MTGKRSTNHWEQVLKQVRLWPAWLLTLLQHQDEQMKEERTRETDLLQAQITTLKSTLMTAVGRNTNATKENNTGSTKLDQVSWMSMKLTANLLLRGHPGMTMRCCRKLWTSQ